MLTLPLQATTDDPGHCELVDVSATRIKYKVANASVFLQLMPINTHGGESTWDEEFLVTPEDNVFAGVCGARFRSAISGQPALVVAQSFAPGDPEGAGGVPFLSTLTLAGQIGSSVILPVVPLASFPPSSPSDGQHILLELPSSYDPIGGKAIRWLCSYNAGTGMWDVSGPPLYAEVQTAEALNSAAYVDLATVGPTIALPRGGDYAITAGFLEATNVGAPTTELMAYTGAGIGAAADADAAAVGLSATTTTPSGTSRTREKTGLTTGSPLTAQYRNTGVASTISGRFMLANPIRIS